MSTAYQTVSRVANETYGHSRRIMPSQPWWDNLESSFHKFPDDFDLDLPTQVLVDGTAAVDLAVPRSPRISTPPICEFTALRTNARFICSCPTMAVKGNNCRINASWVHVRCLLYSSGAK